MSDRDAEGEVEDEDFDMSGEMFGGGGEEGMAIDPNLGGGVDGDGEGEGMRGVGYGDVDGEGYPDDEEVVSITSAFSMR